jgi:elongation factor Ts
MNLDQIKQLRQQTGAGINDCQECLKQAQGDFAKAIELLRKRGVQIAHKKSERQTTEGTIGYYIHSNGKLASVVKVRCETDFVAKNKEFQELAKDLAMHITAMNPEYKSENDVPQEVKDKEKEIEAEKLKTEGKPKEIIEKILQGKLRKFYEQVCLLNQPFVRDDKKSIEDLIKEKIQKLGENIEIGEFVRMEL